MSEYAVPILATTSQASSQPFSNQQLGVQAQQQQARTTSLLFMGVSMYSCSACCHSIWRRKGSTLETSQACAVFLPFVSMQLLTHIKACSAVRLQAVIDFDVRELHQFWIKELLHIS